MGFLAPRDLEEALLHLQREGARALAGGTDLFCAIGETLPSHDLVDLSRLDCLRGITHDVHGWRIGGATSWAEIACTALPQAFTALKEAAAGIGSVQIQNTSTIAGNLCNASPAADGVPPLLVLDAEVELVSINGTRRLPLASFITGVRQTALEPGEILAALLVPEPPAAANSAFVKLGSRRYLVISIAMVAALLVLDDDGRVDDARIAIGACSPVARRLRGLERVLLGRSREDLARASLVAPEHLEGLAPIDDVRGTAAFRLEAAARLCERALARAMSGEVPAHG